MQNKAAADVRLPAAYWICLCVFSLVAAWRLFVAIVRGLNAAFYLDFFVSACALIAAAMQKGRARNLIAGCGLLATAVLTQIVGGGYQVNIGGIFMSGSGLLALRHAADLAYYIIMTAAAVLLLLRRNAAASAVSLGALLCALIYTVSSMVITTVYTGNFFVTWSWWVQNGMLVPIYYAAMLLLALTVFLLGYDDFIAPFHRRRRARLLPENKTARRRGA